MARVASSSTAASDVLNRLRVGFDALTPELRRAAQWIADHPNETGLWSMRQQARSAEVSAPTMVRLARALGFADYASLRRPFQEALTGRSIEYGRRASALQAAPQASRIERLAREIAVSQIADVESVLALNSPERLESAVGAIAAAKRVGFLGVRASFGIAFQFRYAYNLIARNGVLFDGVGGTVHDQVDALGPDDVLIAISQSPYSAPTVEAVVTASKRRVTVVALTDSVVSPLARNAAHFLLFRADSISFFPSMIAPLALVELLVAWLAAKGGKTVLKRLAEVDARLAAQRAYWNHSPRNAIHKALT
ncbi:MAG: MurR/RpiR family transcriptional regulator [Betaproteobacteria bacterium]|nr:MAG: MurR/RpiR family transcriptional regulator [Betaproteobacteria bacterium]